MKKSDFYEIAIKLLGLYLFILFIGILKDFIPYFVFSKNEMTDSLEQDVNRRLLEISYFVSMSVVLAFSIFFILFTKTIVKKICKPSDLEEKLNLFTNKQEVYEMALTITSFLTIVLSLPELLLRLRSEIMLTQNDLPIPDSETRMLYILATRICLGLILLYFVKPLSRLLSFSKNKIRSE